jgi:hypothetical protein
MADGPEAILKIAAEAVAAGKIPDEVSLAMIFGAIITINQEARTASTIAGKLEKRVTLVERLITIVGGPALLGVGYTIYLMLQHIVGK